MRRLALVSAVALGVIWWLAHASDSTPAAARALLAAGWITMPSLLSLSLRLPALRIGVALPATFVTAGVLLVTEAALRTGAAAAPGWLLLTAGIVLGDFLGCWLWFRLLPVPRRLEDPHAPLRLLAVGAHVGLVTLGILIVAASHAGTV